MSSRRLFDSKATVIIHGIRYTGVCIEATMYQDYNKMSTIELKMEIGNTEVVTGDGVVHLENPSGYKWLWKGEGLQVDTPSDQ